MENESVLAQGLVERIGLDVACLTHRVDTQKTIIEQPIKDHQEAVDMVLKMLLDDTHGIIKNVDEITYIGHRVVHGGEKYAKSVRIDEEVIATLMECSKIAPLHNPANIIGIRACQAVMPHIPMVAVFDTAFHQTMPKEAYIYPIDYSLYKEHQIRKYGFHGTSHKYVSQKLAETLGKDIKDMNILSCHLGNGASLTAIKGGKSIDTSMGFTPLAGVVMGTRSGNIDPSIVTYLIKDCGYTIDDVNEMLNKKSGLFGISGISSDFRDIKKAAEEGNERAQLALKIFFYRVRGQIGAYAVHMGGIDAVIFTAGVGENSAETRKACLEGLEFLGVEIDDVRNDVHGELAEISSDASRVKVYVIPTDEELMIAKETVQVMAE